ncbi:MAG: hypothetical protein AAF810_01430 [Cyanobacteria bacterium P01_D01_bin.36]
MDTQRSPKSYEEVGRGKGGMRTAHQQFTYTQIKQVIQNNWYNPLINQTLVCAEAGFNKQAFSLKLTAEDANELRPIINARRFYNRESLKAIAKEWFSEWGDKSKFCSKYLLSDTYFYVFLNKGSISKEVLEYILEYKNTSLKALLAKIQIYQANNETDCGFSRDIAQIHQQEIKRYKSQKLLWSSSLEIIGPCLHPEVWITIPEIHKMTGLYKTRIQQFLWRLMQTGHVERQNSDRYGQGRRTQVYRLIKPLPHQDMLLSLRQVRDDVNKAA